MGDEPKARTPEEIAKEHARIQREIENSANPTPGGLTPDDVANISRQQTEADFHRVQREQWIRENQLPDMGRNPMMDKPVLDESVRRYINADVARDLLKKPENRLRLAAAGLGIFGIILLSLGLRTEGNQTTSVATSVPTTLAPSPSTTLATTSEDVTPASATASASFTKVSGPCSFATQFTDNYSFEITTSGLALTQLSNNHITYGTIEPMGDFTTAAEGQGYSGTIDGTMATGQHFYTAEGCNEVYDFTMQLSAPLISTVELPSPTTTETPTTTTVPATGTSNGRNIPLVLFGLAFLVGALALFFGGSRLAGGPVIAGPLADTDPCADQKKRMSAAERDREAADQRYRQIEELERNVGATQRDATTKQQAAEAAAKNASSYQGADGQTVYTDRQHGERIASAQAALAVARLAAEASQRAFDAAGGAAQRLSAADAAYRANRECEDAKASLDACLRIQAAAAPPPPRTSGGTTTAGPPIVTGTGSPTQTRERPCAHGEVKPGSEISRTKEITVNEMNRAVIGLDAVYPNALSVPLTEFVEFMDFFRRAFKAGKAINTVVNGTIVEGALDTVDATGIADIPDFLTYWDKLTEATLKGLKQTGDLFIERFGKLGDYQLTFTRRINTATCRTWEECEGGQWVKKSEVKIEITRTERNCRTRQTISVYDKSMIPDAINRLFNELESENERGTRELKAFAESCGS